MEQFFDHSLFRLLIQVQVMFVVVTEPGSQQQVMDRRLLPYINMDVMSYASHVMYQCLHIIEHPSDFTPHYFSWFIFFFQLFHPYKFFSICYRTFSDFFFSEKTTLPCFLVKVFRHRNETYSGYSSVRGTWPFLSVAQFFMRAGPLRVLWAGKTTLATEA